MFYNSGTNYSRNIYINLHIYIVLILYVYLTARSKSIASNYFWALLMLEHKLSTYTLKMVAVKI